MMKSKMLILMRAKIQLFLVNHFYKFFTLFLGLAMFSTYIFFRFIRERLPKDIPLKLSVIGFFIILEICCIYAYIIYSYLKSEKKEPNEVLQIIVNEIFKPLDALDNYIKSFSSIKPYYPTFIFWFIKKFEYMFLHQIFDIILFFIPRLILICTFMLDIFYFHKLFYIYKILLIGVLLFIRRYILYSLKRFKKLYLEKLQISISTVVTPYVYGVHPSEWPENFDPEEEDNDDIPPTMALPLEIFIEYYTKNKVYGDMPPEIINIHFTAEFLDKYNDNTTEGSTVIYHLDSEDYKNKEKHEKELKTQFDRLLELYVFYEEYEKAVKKNKILKYIKITIFALYLICWLYILVVSIHTLNIEALFAFLDKTWSRPEISEVISNNMFNNEI